MSSTTMLDANQVIKRVYDDVSGALKTVPASATSFSIELDAADGDSVATRPMAVDVTALLTNMDASADGASSSFSFLNYSIAGFDVSWADLDDTDGEVQAQGSLNGSRWYDIGSATVIGSADGSAFIKVADEPYKLLRLNYTANSNTVGTLSASYILKG